MYLASDGHEAESTETVAAFAIRAMTRAGIASQRGITTHRVLQSREAC